jgi:hypothetical protein
VPFTVDGDNQEALSQQDIDRLRKQVENDQRDQLYWSPDTARPGLIRLWDAVDGSQTSLFDPKHAYEHYLRKVVFKCSACNYTSMKEGLVIGHIRASVEDAKAHRGTEVQDFLGGQYPSKVCGGCGTNFVSRPQNAYKHLKQAIQAGPLHEGATELVIKRFSLTPPVLAEAPTPVAASDDQGTETRQPERSQGPRRRRHRPRHKQQVGA